MSLAIFDLDYTLVEGDCESLWCQLLLEQGLVDAAFVNRIIDYYAEYESGRADFRAYETFLMESMAAMDTAALMRLRAAFLERMRFRLRPYVMRWLNWHRNQGNRILMITATNAFLARPMAELLRVKELICTEVELREECPTGRVLGNDIPYREGKVVLLEAWLSHWNQNLQDSWGYSDSYTDLPLLQRVHNPVAVTPDSNLYVHAVEHGWDILT
jgi:HAD superfamily hydrolase (TIGR01490 family)